MNLWVIAFPFLMLLAAIGAYSIIPQAGGDSHG
jgi:hypothetical protein